MRNRAFRFLLILVACLLLSLPVRLFQQTADAAESLYTAKGHPEKPLLSFAVFSDTHVMATWSPVHRLSAAKFAQALRDIRPLHPDFLVINGDLTNGFANDYTLLQKMEQDNGGLQLFPIMGNHDYYYEWYNKNWTDQLAQQQFKSFFHLQNLYYDRFIKGNHFIWLSSEQYKPHHKQFGEAAWLSPAQIKWFEQTLNKAPNAPTFVFLHQPLDGTVGVTDPDKSTVQSKQLLAIAKKHPHLIWFSGHSHITLDAPSEAVSKDGILFVGCSSVFMPEIPVYGPGHHIKRYQNEVSKSESRFVEVYANRILIHSRHHHNGTWGQTMVFPLQTETPAADRNKSLR